MNDSSSFSDSAGRDAGINIRELRDIINSVVAGRDVNITLVIKNLTVQTSIENTTGGIRELIHASVQEYRKKIEEMQSELTELPSLSLHQRGQFMEDFLQYLRGYEHILRTEKFLADFEKSPQAMMITQPMTFVFGGEAGKRQPPIHVARALKEKKIQASFQGLNAYDRIGITLRRDPSFSSGPLKVIIPAGTCIHPEGSIEFSSFRIPRQESAMGRVLYAD